jgi:hypothetical protein
MYELASPLAGRDTQQLAITHRPATAIGERRLVERELVSGVVGVVERATMALAHADALVRPASDVGDLLGHSRIGACSDRVSSTTDDAAWRQHGLGRGWLSPGAAA